VEPHADAVVNGGPAPSAVPTPAAGPNTTEPTEVPSSRRTRRMAAPAGVPTAADLAAAHAATEWDQFAERDLLGAAESLRAEVASLPLPLEVSDVERSRAECEALLGQLDDYLLPRLRRLDAPLLAVVGGSTGAGKSTLVNSIARREVTRAGVLRPTTRSPVLVHHPYDSGAFLSQRVLPGLTRVTSEAPEPAQPIDIDAPRVTALRLVPHDGITPGLAIIDAPDIDSVVEANRDLAVQMLAAADLWVFVTTATRYSDNVPWQMLRQAVQRGVAVAVVLDRVPLDVMQEVRTHLATLLRDRGLGTSPMFTIPETTLEDGFLPAGLVAPLAGWLRRLALDARARDVVVRRTLIGVLDSLDQRVRVVAAAAEAQAVAEAELRRDVDSRYDAAHEELRRRVLDGGVVRGEVLARWNEFVTTGDVFRSLEPGATTWRDRLRVRIRAPRVAPTQPLLDAVHHGLEDVVLVRLRATSEALVAAWAERPAGRGLLERTRDLASVPPGFGDRLARTLREWRSTLTELVQERATDVRGGRAALGIDGAVAVLAVLALSPPASAREPGDAASAAAAVLAASNGPDAVEPLVGAARADLALRTGELLESERERVLGALDALGIRAGRGEVLLARAAVVEEAR
jgi:Dynamin family